MEFLREECIFSSKFAALRLANVIVKAEEVMRQIVETYNLPNMDFRDLEDRRQSTPMRFGRSVKLAVKTCTFRWWADWSSVSAGQICGGRSAWL